jgi:hypothetical protein
MHCGTQPISLHPLPERLIERIQRSVLLDLARLQCNIRDVEALILRIQKGIEFRSVESPRDPRMRTRQSSTGSILPRKPNPSSRTRATHPHEVPSRLADQSYPKPKQATLLQASSCRQWAPDEGSGDPAGCTPCAGKRNAVSRLRAFGCCESLRTDKIDRIDGRRHRHVHNRMFYGIVLNKLRLFGVSCVQFGD